MGSHSDILRCSIDVFRFSQDALRCSPMLHIGVLRTLNKSNHQSLLLTELLPGCQHVAKDTEASVYEHPISNLIFLETSFKCSIKPFKCPLFTNYQFTRTHKELKQTFFSSSNNGICFVCVKEFYQNNGYSYAIFLANLFNFFLNSNNHGVS